VSLLLGESEGTEVKLRHLLTYLLTSSVTVTRMLSAAAHLVRVDQCFPSNVSS